MSMEILENILSIVVWILFAVVIVIGNIIRLWYFIKCNGVKDCNNQECRYKEYCSRHKEVITEAEIESLKNYIDKQYCRREETEERSLINEERNGCETE